MQMLTIAMRMVYHGITMTNKAKFIGIIAVAAFFGLTLISCLDLLNDQSVATPTANPPAGTYPAAQTVSLFCDTSGASIFYTIDGSAPDAGSARYSAPIPISATTTLRAIAIKNDKESRILTAAYTINASAQLESIAVTTYPTKTQYSIGDSLDTAGMVVTATYSDSTTAAVTGYDLSGFSSTTEGSKTVTVTYEGKTANFTVMVNPPGKTLSSIAITTPPTKTQYNIGETLNTAGMVVTATYSDNTTAAVTGYATSGFDSTTGGQKSVTVSYGGQIANFTVTVNAAKTLLSIAVTTQPTKTVYTQYEALDTAGMVVTATYSDSTTEVVTTYNTSGFSSTTTGQKTVTVTYSGKIASFTVTVNPAADGSQVASWKGLTVPAATTAKHYSTYQSKTDVILVAPASTSSGYAYNVLSYSLNEYAGQEITINVSMDVWLAISTKVAWQINQAPSYPVIAGSTSTSLTANQWNTVTGSTTVTPESGNILYLSKDQLVGGNPATLGDPVGNVEIYITGFTITINGHIENPEPPNDARIKDPAAQTTQLSNPSFTLVTKPHGGGNKWLIQAQNLGYETWDEDTSGDANFRWYGQNQGGGAAFRAEWGDPVRPKDFLARVGYFWGNGGTHTSYGNIYCGFNFTKSGQYRGNFSYIGIYGWSRNPTVEYYIVENSYGNAWNDHAGYIARLNQDTIQGDEMEEYTLDGSVYKVYKKARTGPSIEGNNTSFTQFFSVRQTARTSGTISITEHFKEWEKRGMNLGSNMYECKFKVEVGGTPSQNGGSATGWFDATFIQFYRTDNTGAILHITQ